jgi:hypothetical protein
MKGKIFNYGLKYPTGSAKSSRIFWQQFYDQNFLSLFYGLPYQFFSAGLDLTLIVKGSQQYR